MAFLWNQAKNERILSGKKPFILRFLFIYFYKVSFWYWFIVYTELYYCIYSKVKGEFYSDEKCSFYDTNRTINRNRHLHSDSDATKIGDSTCFVYTRKPRCHFYRDVYKSMDGYLRRSRVVVWILYFRGVPTRHRFPRAIAYSLCDTRSLFPTEISKDARKPQILMDFQLRIGAHSRCWRSFGLRNFLLGFRDRSSKHVLRPLRLSRIWYSDSQYGRLWISTSGV